MGAAFAPTAGCSRFKLDRRHGKALVGARRQLPCSAPRPPSARGCRRLRGPGADRWSRRTSTWSGSGRSPEEGMPMARTPLDGSGTFWGISPDGATSIPTSMTFPNFGLGSTRAHHVATDVAAGPPSARRAMIVGAAFYGRWSRRPRWSRLTAEPRSWRSGTGRAAVGNGAAARPPCPGAWPIDRTVGARRALRRWRTPGLRRRGRPRLRRLGARRRPTTGSTTARSLSAPMAKAC